eukprot:m.489358 g.489358  ORF g.489358 m.489358 type:complete len:71 (+) comp21765_c0_seq7:300-512(+)
MFLSCEVEMAPYPIIVCLSQERLKDLREKLSQDDAAGSSFGPSTTSRSRPPMQTTNGLENVKHVVSLNPF